jgi:hypothetical protein
MNDMHFVKALIDASVSFDSLAQYLESRPAKQARQEYLPFTLQACENFG